MVAARVLLAIGAACCALVGCSPAPQPAAPATALPATVLSATGSPSSGSTASRGTPSAITPATTTHSRPAPTRRPAATASRPTPSRTPVPAGLAELPVSGSTAGASQAITVAAGSWGSTQARVQAWDRIGGRWVEHGPSVAGWLGAAGLTSNAREGFTGTPVGSFTLTQAFGNNADPGSRLPYFQAVSDDWWSGDSSSATYNSHQRCAASQCPFRTDQSENLHDAGWVYGYAVVIDYNTGPAVAGRGSAFFLHVSADQPTEGCVSIPQPELVQLLRWLDPGRHPRILIGIG